MIAILQSRHGGPAAAAVMTHAIPGLGGVSAAFVAVHLLAVPLGSALALVIGLGVSVAWNIALFFLSRERPG